MLRLSSNRASSRRIGEHLSRCDQGLQSTATCSELASRRTSRPTHSESCPNAPSHCRSMSFRATPQTCIETSRMASAPFPDRQRFRRRPDRELTRRMWGELQQQWALDPAKAQETSADELLDFIRTLSGAKQPSTFLATQDVVLDETPYRLSSYEFDLKGKAKTPSLMPIAPATSLDLVAINSIFEHLMTMTLSESQSKEAIKLRLYACFSIAAPLHAVQALNTLVYEVLRAHKQWPLDEGILHMLVNLARIGPSFRPTALLAVLMRRHMANKPGAVMTKAMADLCIHLLHSPNLLDRLRSRRLIDQCMMREGAYAALISLPMVMIAGLLDGLVRSAEEVVESTTVRRLASILDQLVMESEPDPSDASLQFCIAALTLERALGPATSLLPDGADFRRIPDFRPMHQRLTSLASRGHLNDETTNAIVHVILLRSHSQRLDLCETEPEIKAYLLKLSQQYSDIKPGSTSWGWAMRVLMGMTSSLVRPYRKGRRNDRVLRPDAYQAKANLLQVHEADALLETYMKMSKSTTPTSFLCLPLLANFMKQFPPQVERSMAIYRSMRGADQTSISLFDRFFSHFRRHRSSYSQIPTSPPNGPDRRSIIVMLDSLLQCEPPEVAFAKEIVEDLIKLQQQGFQVLDAWERLRYTAVLLPLLEEEEAVELWRSFADTQNAVRPTTWWSDWHSGLWASLMKHCAGIGQPVSLSRAARPKQPDAVPLAESSMPSMRVSLPIFFKVVSTAIKSRQFQGRPFLFTTLVHKLGQMASSSQVNDETGGASRGRGQPPTRLAILETVTLLHELVNEDRALEPDLPLLNALMDSYSRCRCPSVVYEIWDALAVASLSSHGSFIRDGPACRPLESASQQGLTLRPEDDGKPANEAAINGATISILLDTTGRCGHEARGRRAWKFVGRLDEDVIGIIKRRLGPNTGTNTDRGRLAYLHARPYLIRNTNAWNSWLEFLCRRRCLPEALQQLEEMKRQSRMQGTDGDVQDATHTHAIMPNAKTLGILLRFAAQDRVRSEQQAQQGSGKADAASPSVWTQLRERVRSGEFGQHVWEEVKCIGTEDMI